MKLIVGLGNPGESYAKTRHNVGFRVLDLLESAGPKPGLVYLKPQKFMNRSGDPVLAAASFYKIKPEDILVIHDELDLPFGTIKLKKGGGHAGHNGLRDIIRVLGSDFSRIRIGIDKPADKMHTADYVLSAFSKPEEEALSAVLEKAFSLALAF